ncbi:hypothetical protein BaRGS_00000406 [Batillaria attramentaria]|uniref:Carboxylesterase type B domain-containing protein n=1 Tax=Batillaria attramentaria TaxID=370345 RepID=A0ABD0M9U5_9CAEN
MYAVFCLLLVIAGVESQPTVVKCIPDGALRGTRVQVGADSHVDMFLRIPYARPPIGDLRFQKPLAPVAWSGVRDATQLGPQCPQRPSPGTVVQLPNSEDCLFLNVYTPKPLSSEPMPVMVWIHGGGYMTGAGNVFNGTQLAARGVVVVTINYRLDALGFLSTEDGASPGNYGLWDMIRALEWVRDSISAFKGDPSDVTIFGESAGSGAVSLLIMSTAAKGLFHKAIMESGVSLGDWAVAYPGVDPKPRERAVKLASEVGCETADSAHMVTCLRAKDAMDIINATTDMFLSVVANDTRLQFRPVVETTFGQSGVFAATPDVVLENGWFANVTTIRGFNSREYAIFFAPDQGGMTVEEFREKAKTFVRQNMAQSFFDVGIERITDQLVDAYLVKPNITDPIQRRAAAIELQSDFIFVAPTIRELQLTNKFPAPPQYLYRFSYRSPNRLTKPWQGAIHADELHYVFGYPLSNRFLFNPFVSNWTDEDRRVSQEVLSLWTNFAKYGNPTPNGNNEVKWLPWTPALPSYLNVGSVPTLQATDQSKLAKVKAMMDIINTIHDKSIDALIG